MNPHKKALKPEVFLCTSHARNDFGIFDISISRDAVVRTDLFSCWMNIIGMFLIRFILSQSLSGLVILRGGGPVVVPPPALLVRTATAFTTSQSVVHSRICQEHNSLSCLGRHHSKRSSFLYAYTCNPFILFTKILLAAEYTMYLNNVH